ncbi:MAG: hypothetical protein L0207_03285 [Chlamydiae bacterium]|nr:hypothetical protein [Chlamydiota bacterium]
MFSYRRNIFLRETDATKAIYFSELFKLGLETFEEFLINKGFLLGELIESSDFLMPIVRAEADFIGPIKAGDKIEARLDLSKMGRRSFALLTSYYHLKKEIVVGKTTIIHATISKQTKQSIPLPTPLKEVLKQI